MNVLMPQLGETVAEGTVAAWHKKAGDKVAKDEILLDVETDKAATEVPAPVDGVMTSVLVQAGETVDVGTVLAVIDGPEAAGEAPTAAEPSDDAQGEGSSSPAPQPESDSTEGSAPKSVARTPPGRASRRLRLSPVVRRLLGENDLDPREIAGSGRDGRITRADIMSFLKARAAKPVAEPPSAPIESVAKPQAALPADGERVPFDRIRRVTAAHMVRSKATSAHVMQAVEVDFAGVDRVRLRHRVDWRAKHGFSLTYLPFIARAVCLSLHEFPRINSSVDGDGLLLHKAVHLSIAVNLNFEGLVAPVIRDADGLTVAGLARGIHDIGRRAREGDLDPDEYSGGTYTLSNNGSYGTLLTGAIINQPQVAILSVDAVRKRPVVVESPEGDSIAIRPVGILAQSFDHRAIDGAYSAAFLHKIRSLLEQKDWSDEI